MRWLTPWMALVAAAVLAPACNNECSFKERCVGDVVEICGGTGQVVNREVLSNPCEAPNAICRAFDEDIARCVHASATTCDDDFVPQCDGDLFLYCPGSHYGDSPPADYVRYALARDCTTLDDPSLPGYAPDAVASCVADADGARCAY